MLRLRSEFATGPELYAIPDQEALDAILESTAVTNQMHLYLDWLFVAFPELEAEKRKQLFSHVYRVIDFVLHNQGAKFVKA